MNTLAFHVAKRNKSHYTSHTNIIPRVETIGLAEINFLVGKNNKTMGLTELHA